MKLFITGASGFIGTNLVEELIHRKMGFLNFDLQKPLNPQHQLYWKKGSILDQKSLVSAVQEFQPDAVIHLAARAECDETTTVEMGYRANTEGVAHLLEAVRACPSVQRLVVVSSQFVCGPGYQPKHDEDFHPVTIYGQSKVITEQLTRNAGLSCCWTLVRPTNIWGPWHLRYQREFWKAVQKGFYVHPSGKPVMRCYGYVGNVVDQMLRILQVPTEQVHGQVFYLGDPPDDIRSWVNAFSRALRGRRAWEVPRWFLWISGQAGGLIEKISGKSFYINPSRARSMTSDYEVSMEKTYAVLGHSIYSLEEGVYRTVEWLRLMEKGGEAEGKGKK
jgi:GlcNAc-P-P-Und epimerase